jgi:hypothetical protein
MHLLVVVLRTIPEEPDAKTQDVVVEISLFLEISNT